MDFTVMLRMVIAKNAAANNPLFTRMGNTWGSCHQMGVSDRENEHIGNYVFLDLKIRFLA